MIETLRRTGRGVILSRAKRDVIWPVFEEYRGQLTSRKLKEVDDAYREIASLLEKEGESGAELLYSAIVVDETQDFGLRTLDFYYERCPRLSPKEPIHV